MHLLFQKSFNEVIDERRRMSSHVAQKLPEHIQVCHKILGHIPAAVMNKLFFLK